MVPPTALPHPARAKPAATKGAASSELAARLEYTRDDAAARYPDAAALQDEALAALERHARRFVRGRLAEERESLRVPTLVMLGRSDEARRAAARFHARFPSSLCAPVVERPVEAIP
jgi:pimeloyl-ACP methyl ester carboxylesterase